MHKKSLGKNLFFNRQFLYLDTYQVHVHFLPQFVSVVQAIMQIIFASGSLVLQVCTLMY